MSSDFDRAQKRLSEIKNEISRVIEEAQSESAEVTSLLLKTMEQARQARDVRRSLEDLKAEALYLGIRYDLETPEVSEVDTGLNQIEAAWKEVKALSQPVRPGAEWLEKIRELEAGRAGTPALSEEEKAELESRLKDNVCPICVNFALDGTCTLEAFDTCPIELYLARLVTMIEEMGHRPWMEDYFERMYRDICPGCQGRKDGDYCPPREEGECSLFTYLPTVVRTIEDFMEERSAARS